MLSQRTPASRVALAPTCYAALSLDDIIYIHAATAIDTSCVTQSYYVFSPARCNVF
jgi:hypothetical protein